VLVVSCKLIIIWVTYERKKKGWFFNETSCSQCYVYKARIVSTDPFVLVFCIFVCYQYWPKIFWHIFMKILTWVEITEKRALESRCKYFVLRYQQCNYSCRVDISASLPLLLTYGMLWSTQPLALGGMGNEQ